MKQTLLRINSFDRNVPSSLSLSDFEINTNNNSRIQEVVQISLKSCHFMNAFYNVAEYNNTFYFIRQDGVTQSWGIEIGPGKVVTLRKYKDQMYVYLIKPTPGAPIVSVDDGAPETMSIYAGGYGSTNYPLGSAVLELQVDGSVFVLTFEEPTEENLLPAADPAQVYYAWPAPGASVVTVNGLPTVTSAERPDLFVTQSSITGATAPYDPFTISIAIDGFTFNTDVALAEFYKTTTTSITLPAKQYDIAALEAEFTTQMATAGVTVTNFSLGTATGKLSWDTDIPIVYPEFKEAKVYNPAAYVFGVSNGLAGGTALPPSSQYVTSYTADALVDLAGPTEVYLHISPMGDSYTNDSFGGTEDIVDCIPITACFGEANHYICPDLETNMISYDVPTNLSKLRVQLKDGYGNVLDLNGTSLTALFSVFSM
jgi:hypothetical protein